MIFGIGTDIVYIPRIQELLNKYGDKIAKRILSDFEFEKFIQLTNSTAFLAKRFAVKEAAAKALGTGFRDGLKLKHIVVKNDEQGKPELTFHKPGLLQKLNVGRSLVSLSDEGDYALAFVTLMERK